MLVLQALIGCGAAGNGYPARSQLGEEQELGRPLVPLISRHAAAEAALEVIDEHGLKDFKIRDVAARLGVKTPSLYNHFKNKEELLEEVSRLLLMKQPALAAEDDSFESRLLSLCLETRRALLRHPNAAMLLLDYFPRHLLLEFYNAAARDNPYHPSIHMAVIEATEKLTFGSALFAASADSRGVPAMPDIDVAAYPALARAMSANPFDDEQLFLECLRIFLAGAARQGRDGDA